jgi:serine protease Do
MSDRTPVTARARKGALASVAAIAIVASGALGATVYEARMPAMAQAIGQTTATAAAPASFADVVEKVKPAVVAVRVKVANVASDASQSLGGDNNLDQLPPQLRELFKRFGGDSEGGGTPFGRGPRGGGGGGERQGLGSGFFISGDGYVVTNNHVIDGAKTVQVTTDDGRTLDAKVIGADPKTDVALLKVTDGGSFPYVRLAKAAPRVGDWVVAIGNPFGLGGTVTAGIVSARGRDIGASAYDDFLQIDAPINKGNSGGPTFNLNGEVVGVNTAIFSPSGGSVGLAFAIPSETVSSVVNQLESDGKVTRGYLGVQIQPLSKDLADSLGLSTEKGALVNSAEAGTPAAKAGLKAGDVITAVNGDPVATARELSRKIAGLKPGSKVDLSYLRNGRQQTAPVELGTLPNDRAAQGEPREERSPQQLGLRLGPSDEGVAVVAVDPSGPAAAKGIKEGDVILEVGGQAVSKPADIKAGLDAAAKEGRKAVLLRVKSREGVRFVAIAMPKAG